MTESLRLAKRLAHSLPCSRREAELYITGGWVRVDGVVVEEPQFRVTDAQKIELDPQTKAEHQEPVTILLHQPADDFRLTIVTRAHTLLGYVNRILDFFLQPVEDRLQSKIANPKSAIVEPLTDRELEILRLIAAGHSNAEIGQRLSLALSTVKGHNLRIFNKLQAQNRTEAVARAREWDLL